MTSIPASLTDLKVQVAMSMTLGMVLDDSNIDSNGLMGGSNALLGDEGRNHCLFISLPLFLIQTPLHLSFYLSIFTFPLNSTPIPLTPPLYQLSLSLHLYINFLSNFTSISTFSLTPPLYQLSF